MKRKNGFSVLLLLPVFALVLSVGGIFAYKLYSDRMKPAVTEEVTPPVTKVVPALQTGSTKPSAGYGSMGSGVAKASATAQISLTEPAITPTPTPKPMDLDTMLSETDDTADTDLKEIDTAAQGL